MNAGSRVDDYISRLPDWQQAVCQQVRQLVHDADPEVEETTALLEIFQAVIATNRAGGWRRIQASPT
jgi:uncharacterized protein YdhG (YjbR/CyaY superfamily)